MKISKLRRLTLLEISEEIRNGNTSPTEILSLLIAQIRRTDSKVKAYVTVCEDSATKLAEASEIQIKTGKDLGPLHGIPVAIKDIFDTAGIITASGSKILKDFVPKTDSTVVSRLKSVGAIVLGKVNTHEFAGGVTSPPTRNPWDLRRIPGGSSGGSAAAIAASSAIATIGSDTGGSIRIPSSLCGVVGLKPTYGLVSRSGAFPENWSMDTVGPITRRVEDAALLLSATAGFDKHDPSSSKDSVPDYLKSVRNKDLSGLKIGVPKNYFFEHCNREIIRAVLNVIDLLCELGCETVEFDFPHLKEIWAAWTAIDCCETTALHEKWLSERPGDYVDPYVRLNIEQGLFIPASYYIQALRIRGIIIPEIIRLLNGFDVIVSPTTPFVATLVGQRTVKCDGLREDIELGFLRYVAPFNLLGMPSLSVPCGFSRDGLPIGIQITGNPYRESTVLRVGAAYEDATDWHQRFPKLP